MAQDGIKFELIGAREAQEVLKSLTAEERNKVYQTLNKRGAAVVKQKLQQNAPRGSVNIVGRRGKYKRKTHVKDSVRVVKSQISSNGFLIGFLKKAFQVRFLEFGTEVRETRRGANRGTMKPRPFVQRSHDEAAAVLQVKLGQNYQEELNKTLKSKVKIINNKISKFSK